MLRGLFIFAIVAAMAAGAAWLADNPGHVSMVWQDYKIETSAAVLLVVAAAVSVIVAVTYRFWLALTRAPAAVAGAWQERGRRKGYLALSKGMVAVAAGDADEAAKQARRADGLLNNPPLTMLLSAQSAQLNGNEDAAATFFQRMADDKETEFLGLRGLLGQALATGDEATALGLARRAWRVQPNSAWVSEHLFTLLTHAGEWTEADAVMDGARRRKLLANGQAERRQWIVRHQAAATAPNPNDALKRAKKVFDANPDFVPGALALATLWLAEGNKRKAARVIERTWSLSPHPDLLAPYWQATRAEDTLTRLRTAEKLAERNPTHAESHFVMAEQALKATLWGEARRHASKVLENEGTAPSARVCRFMAALEEGEHKDDALARDWLMRASRADPDPAWVCRDCGHVAPTWTAACDHCDGFDTLAWTVPSHARILVSESTQEPDALLIEAEKSDPGGAADR